MFVGGQADLDERGNVQHPGDLLAQAQAAMTHVERVVSALGGRFQMLMADHRDAEDRPDGLGHLHVDRVAGFRRLEQALTAQGHGAVAVLIMEYPNATAHAITVHNQHGQVLYVDAQNDERPVSAHRPGGARASAVPASAATAAGRSGSRSPP